MRRPRVLVFHQLTADVIARLELDFDTDVLSNNGEDDRRSLLASISKYDALCPTVAHSIDRELIQACKGKVKIISNFGVGTDNIDIQAASDAGILVTNTPGVLTEATADLAITLLLMITRRAGEGERLCRSMQWQGWNPTQLLGSGVTGNILGLVGFGRIARAVAHRAVHGFGMRIKVYNRSAVSPQDLSRYKAKQISSLDALLEMSDAVSLHCPSSPETRHLINDAAFKTMKSSAVLINTARGDVVDEDGLVHALLNQEIAGAALDVYENEPDIHPGLLTMENVVLLPHLGSATSETRSAMGMRMVDNLVEFFAGNEPPDRIA